MKMIHLLILPALLIAGHVVAQDFTHPMDMGLPETDFVRPNPADYQLSLDNGLTAYIAKADQVPLVTLSAFIRAGKVSDDIQGAAEVLLEALLNDGPAENSPTDFKDALRLMTARFSVDMHDEWTEISLNIPKEDLDEALTLFAGLIRSPAITKEAVASTAKALRVPDSAKTEGSLGAAVERFYEMLYADHPYGQRPTPRDFKKLTADDVSEFHERFFAPSNMTLAIAGDIDVGEVQSRVRNLFGNMPHTKAPSPRQMPAIEFGKAAQHSYPVEKLQSWLVIGHALPVVPLEGQAALDVMNYILGAEHLIARLLVNTRVLYGYTNDASGFLEDRWFGPGSYTFRSYSRPEVIKPLFDNMMAEITGIRSGNITEEELFIAKGALRDGTFPIRYLDGYATARDFAIERLRYGDHSRSASYLERVAAVTAKDVTAAANKYIRPESLQVILVGSPASLVD